jgi:hypothetical protein
VADCHRIMADSAVHERGKGEIDRARDVVCWWVGFGHE